MTAVRDRNTIGAGGARIVMIAACGVLVLLHRLILYCRLRRLLLGHCQTLHCLPRLHHRRLPPLLQRAGCCGTTSRPCATSRTIIKYSAKSVRRCNRLLLCRLTHLLASLHLHLLFLFSHLGQIFSKSNKELAQTTRRIVFQLYWNVKKLMRSYSASRKTTYTLPILFTEHLTVRRFPTRAFTCPTTIPQMKNACTRTR